MESKLGKGDIPHLLVGDAASDTETESHHQRFGRCRRTLIKELLDRTIVVISIFFREIVFIDLIPEFAR